MKVILLGELRGKGGEGDIVDVAQGYAENCLFPNKIAQPATPGNIKQLKERAHNIQQREEKRLSNARDMKAKLDDKQVFIEAKVGENNQLFGSITAAQIAKAINEQLSVEIDRKRISRGATIKTAGTHGVEINLYRDINARVSVTVGASMSEMKSSEEAAEVEAAEADTNEVADAEKQEASENE